MPPHECDLCAARFGHDNALASHMRRHQDLGHSDDPDNDRRTNERQAAAGQVEDLQELLVELRDG